MADLSPMIRVSLGLTVHLVIGLYSADADMFYH